VFFALLAATMILLVPQQNQSLRITAQRGGLTALVSFLFIAAPLLRIISSQLRGLETVLTRSPEESIQFGGSIARLLVPWGVWLPTKLKPVVLPTEFEWTISPILGVIGVWILIIGIAVSMSSRSSTNNNHKSIRFIFIWALLFYTAAGVSLLFAYAIDPSFRCWNRLSIVIMTLALVALGVTLSRFGKFNKAWFPILLIVAVLSQLSPLHDSGIGPEPDTFSKEAFTALQQVAAVIRQATKPGCQILQLPQMQFPEGGQIGLVGAGSHLWLPLLLEDLRWTFGGMKGTVAGDFWLLNQFSAEQIVSKLYSKELCAVVIDTREGGADKLTQELINSLNPSLTIESPSYYKVLVASTPRPNEFQFDQLNVLHIYHVIKLDSSGIILKIFAKT